MVLKLFAKSKDHPEPVNFWGTSAVVPGFDHVQIKKNGQDQAFSGTTVYKGRTYNFGGSMDGNGAGHYSEFGAIMAKDYLESEIGRLIRSGAPFIQIPQQLFDGLILELYRILPANRSMPEKINFILSRLLFTVFAFIQGPEETVVFALGDGVLVVNGKVIIGKERKIISDNYPDYVAYALIERLDPTYFTTHKKPALKEAYKPKTRFEVLTFKTAEIEQIFVGSDAWHDEVELLMKFLEMITKYDPAYPEDVQDQMNAWSGMIFRDPANQDPVHFSDDASLAFVQRLHPTQSA